MRLLQRSAEIDWTPWHTDDCWYFYTFESDSVDDVPTGVVAMHKRDTSGKRISGRTLTSRDISWVVTAERLVTLDEAAALMQLEWTVVFIMCPLPLAIWKAR